LFNADFTLTKRECVNNSSSYDYKLCTIKTLSQYIIIIIRKRNQQKVQWTRSSVRLVGPRREDNMRKRIWEKMSEWRREKKNWNSAILTSAWSRRKPMASSSLCCSGAGFTHNTNATTKPKKKRTTKSTQRSQQTGRNEQKCVKWTR